ncbi:MAG: DNA-binding protein [Promethearchaeota archaeon]|nr:MAG: DNA-binding protein [Candidatus Lokiarchaeota archaeon]
MKSIETNIGRVIVARVIPDEDLIDAIKVLVKNYDIKGGLINVIGAFKKFTIGYFDLNTKEYNFKTFEENVELISCMGNISYKDGDPIIHIHISVGKGDYNLIGGHLSQPSIISVTAEVFIYEINQKLNRVNEPFFNLSLLEL